MALRVDVQRHFDADTGSSGGAEDDLPEDFADRIARAVAVAARHRGFHAGTIDVAVVDDRQIQEVNRQYLDHDWETDVISFPYGAEAPEVEGELMISWETAQRQARLTGWPPMTELMLYAVHGTLHLTGMDDVRADQRREMRQAERAILHELQLEGCQSYDVGRRDT